ncbi:M48 family metalloprotease, partial [Reinekea blandensis]
MDFFEHQDRARQKTGQLVVLFILGIIATLIVVNLVCFIGFWLFYSPPGTAVSVNPEQAPALLRGLLGDRTIEWQLRNGGLLSVWLAWWHSNLNWQISVGVVAAVLIGTGFRYLELAGGGRRVAEWAGAKPCDMTTTDPDRKQLINVCEEMAIAAGMPVPELYVMEQEQSINAFVAGYSPDEAVLVVTKGALEALNRDQLQGVIGHEYSHILNGDMRL